MFVEVDFNHPLAGRDLVFEVDIINVEQVSNDIIRVWVLGIYVRLANPRGFCAGVDRAIEIVNRVLDKFGSPVYVRHEVVHNKTVVEALRRRGAIFVDEVSEIPEGSTVVFSAHGVAKQVQRDAEERDLRVFDATCPLVSKVHNEVVKFSDQSRETVLIGHAGHPEVDGTLGPVSYTHLTLPPTPYV